jgi:hypothetical protein
MSQSNRVKVGTVQIDTFTDTVQQLYITIIVKFRSASRTIVTKSVPCDTSPPCGSHGSFPRRSRNDPSLRPPPMADLGYPTLVGYTPTIDFLSFMSIPLCSGHIQN